MIRKIQFMLVLLSLSVPVAARAEQTVSSIEKLLAAGQPVTCTFQQALEDGSQSGTVYIADEKMRGDFTVNNAQGTNLMHMVREGEWMYTWGGMMGAQGIKMKASAAANNVGNPQGPEFGKDMQFDCSPWSADPSLLAVPAGVEFVEMGALMPISAQAGIPDHLSGSGAAGIDMKQLQCSACDQIEASEQDACRQMMGC